MRITDAEVESATCPPGKKDVLLFDEALPGFGVRVSCKGNRTFIFQYRVGAKVRRTPLGTFGTELTAAAARKKAESLRGKVRDAGTPLRSGKQRGQPRRRQRRRRRSPKPRTPSPCAC